MPGVFLISAISNNGIEPVTWILPILARNPQISPVPVNKEVVEIRGPGFGG